MGCLPKCLETQRWRQFTMHAVFTRNVAANLLIHKRYSWGSPRVRPYCFLLFCFVPFLSPFTMTS